MFPQLAQRPCVTLTAFGISHKAASVAIRGRVALTPEQMVEALQQFCRLTTNRGVAILPTCSRSELHLEIDHPIADGVFAWLAGHRCLTLDELRTCAYVRQNESAVHHMVRVVSGLDSMVFGEPQILGQMKSAYVVAREAGTVDSLFGRLFQVTFSTAKTVRTDTVISENPVPAAFAAVGPAKQILNDLYRSQALLVSIGETITLIACHLLKRDVKRIMVADRTLEHTSLLAEQFSVHAVLLSEIPKELANSNIVTSPTISQLPILGKGAVECALKQREHKPMFMVDITVSCDIEPETGKLDGVYLYSVDDLHEIVVESSKSCQGAAQTAGELVGSGVTEFMQHLRELAAMDVLRVYRQQTERLCDEELDRAQRQLTNDVGPAEVMAQSVRGLTNELLYMSSVQMKKISAGGCIDASALAQELFILDEGVPRH